MDPQVPTTMMGTVGNSHKQMQKNKCFSPHWEDATDYNHLKWLKSRSSQ